MRTCEGDVLGDAAVEQEVVLQHHAQVLAEVAQLEVHQVEAVDDDAPGQRTVEGHRQRNQGALARAARPDQCRGGPGLGAERDVLQHRHPLVVFEAHIVELDVAAQRREWRARRVLLVFGRHLADFADAVKTGKRLGELRADVGELHHRHCDQCGEGEVHHEVADRHLSRADRVAADEHHRDADQAEDDRRERGDTRYPGERLRDVAEDAVRALGEDQLFALLGRVGLHDAHAAERLGEAAGYFGVDLAALAEQWAQALERHGHAGAERAEHQHGDGGQLPVEIQQDDQRQQCREDRSGELHQAGTDQVPDAFGIGHDARDEDAGLRRVEVADRQAHHVRFDVLAHLGDGALRGYAEHLRQRERRDRLDERRGRGRHGQLRQQIPLIAQDHVVHQKLRGGGEDEAGEPVDDHQAEAETKALAVQPDEGARVLHGTGADLLLVLATRGLVRLRLEASGALCAGVSDHPQTCHLEIQSDARGGPNAPGARPRIIVHRRDWPWRGPICRPWTHPLRRRTAYSGPVWRSGRRPG